MTDTRFTIAAALAAGIAAFGALAAAQADKAQQTTTLLTTALEGIPGKEANVVLFEVGPGFETPTHTHPGHVFVYVIDGAIEVDVEGQDPVTVKAGEAFHEPPDQTMVGRNASTTDDARFVVFQVGEQGQPLMVSTQ